MPTQRTKKHQFLFWLLWVLVSTLPWVISWAVMKYVLNIHPEHISNFWFFIVGGLIYIPGQWLMVREIFKDKYENKYPRKATPDLRQLIGEFYISQLFSVFILTVFVLPGSTSFLITFYWISIGFSSTLFDGYIKRSPGFKNLPLKGTIYIIIIIITAWIEISFDRPISQLIVSLGFNIYSFSILSLGVTSMVSGKIVNKIYNHLPDDLPIVEPKKINSSWRVLIGTAVIILFGLAIGLNLYVNPEILSPCNMINSRFRNSDCIQTWAWDLSYNRRNISLSTDGSHIAYIIDQSRPKAIDVRVVNSKKAEVIAELDLSEWDSKWDIEYDSIINLTFSPTHDQIALLTSDELHKNNHLYLWDFATNTIHTHFFEDGVSLQRDNLKFSPDGKFLGMLLYDDVFVVEIKNGDFGQVYNLVIEKSTLNLNFANSGNFVTFVNWTDVYKWDFTSGNPPTIISQGNINNTKAALDAENNYLEIWVEDEILKFRNGEKTLSLIFSDYSNILNGEAAFSPNGEYLLIADDDGEFWVWQTSDGVLLYSEKYQPGFKIYVGLRGVSISNTGIVLIETYEGLQVWDIFHATP